MKKIDLRVSVYTPDDTDPQLVSEVVDTYLDYGAMGGGPCNWSNWFPAGSEVIRETHCPDRRPTVARVPSMAATIVRLERAITALRHELGVTSGEPVNPA
jgi:hypothetical protein